jgi:hypothetical protein
MAFPVGRFTPGLIRPPIAPSCIDSIRAEGLEVLLERLRPVVVVPDLRGQRRHVAHLAGQDDGRRDGQGH